MGLTGDRVHPTRTSLDRSPGPAQRLCQELVINIVEEAEGEMTVSGVADLLAVDPSVACRMVSDCISGGYLERMDSPYTYSTDTPPCLDKGY